ncbi:MAG: hypothetical protein JKY94_05280 [Rhodobacteraceae bacterium]|nr:hypothetical protein [Paracoccaceae bacterium]
MSRLVMAIIATGFLAACGADSVPTRPKEETKPSGTGITLSGSARVGVVYGPKGTF